MDPRPVDPTLIGLWLMLAPSVFDTTATAADITHLAGALVVVVSVVAMGEVIRAARFLNVALGGLLAIAPWFVSGAGMAAAIDGTLCGAALIILAFARGPKRETYGSWDRFVV